MEQDFLLEKIEKTADLLYQNREQEGLAAVAELLQIFQKMLQNMTVDQKANGGNFAIMMLRELLERYQYQDMLGMADCLMEKSVLFVQFMSE